MRYLEETLRRHIHWRLRPTPRDSLFRGPATVRAPQRPQLNGKPLDDWQLQTLAMCPTGGHVHVRYHRPSHITLESLHPDHIGQGNRNVVELKRDSNSRFLYLEIVQFSSTASKIGRTAFFRLAETAMRLGFKRVELLAAGGTQYKNPWTQPFNGYYTWPRFGFDAELWPVTLAKLQGIQHLSGCQRLLDVMERDPEWWKINGDGSELTFDLQEGSRSWHTLYTYLNS